MKKKQKNCVKPIIIFTSHIKVSECDHLTEFINCVKSLFVHENNRRATKVMPHTCYIFVATENSFTPNVS